MSPLSNSAWGRYAQLFPELLKASHYVTENPEEADYFYADAWVFWPPDTYNLGDIVAAIREKGPWFDRKNSTDHIFMISGAVRCPAAPAKECSHWKGYGDLRGEGIGEACSAAACSAAAATAFKRCYLPSPLAADQGRCQNVHFEEATGLAPDQAVRNALLLLHCKFEQV